MSRGKVCTELLLEELKTPLVSETQAWRLLERLASCFVSVANDVSELFEKISGNGTPGGLELEVHDLKVRLDETLQSINQISGRIESMFNETENQNYGRRKTDLYEKPVDPFRTFVTWLTEKVVPPLIVAFVLWVSQVILFGAFILLALTTGLIKIP